MTRHGRRAVRRAIERLAAKLRRRMLAHGVRPAEEPRRKGECGRLEWVVREVQDCEQWVGIVRVWWNSRVLENARGETNRGTGGCIEVEFERVGHRQPYVIQRIDFGTSGARAMRAVWPRLAAQLRDRDLPMPRYDGGDE